MRSLHVLKERIVGWNVDTTRVLAFTVIGWEMVDVVGWYGLERKSCIADMEWVCGFV